MHSNLKPSRGAIDHGQRDNDMILKRGGDPLNQCERMKKVWIAQILRKAPWCGT